ncbi:MAG: hypothetical protein QNK22_00705 [Xanthomonadales bacterium]|nr:hypothetical protein [Xanthomonadales bacterium]
MRLIVFWMARVLVCALASTPAMVLAVPADDIAAGDQAWTRRAEGHQGFRAAAAPIETAINAYRRALDATPGNLEARWKLLRAFHFKGEFVLEDKKARHELYIKGREIAKAGVLQIERDYGLGKGLFKMNAAAVANAVGNQDAVAEFFFWGSANWGLWGQYSGK